MLTTALVKGSTKIYYYPLCLTEKYHLLEYFNDIWLMKNKLVHIKVHDYLKV